MSFTTLIHDPFLWLALGGWIFSGVIYALPAPKQSSSGGYVFVFKLLNFLGSNLDRLKLPRQ